MTSPIEFSAQNTLDLNFSQVIISTQNLLYNQCTKKVQTFHILMLSILSIPLLSPFFFLFFFLYLLRKRQGLDSSGLLLTCVSGDGSSRDSKDHMVFHSNTLSKSNCLDRPNMWLNFGRQMKPIQNSDLRTSKSLY